MTRFCFIILFVSQSAFATPFTCQQIFESSARATRSSDVISEALSHSQFANLEAVEALVYEFASRGLITTNAADQFRMALLILPKNNSKLFLRFKFAFNALEAAAHKWDEVSLEKNNNQDLQKKLIYVAIWTLVFPNEGIGKLAIRNNYSGYSIENILQDRIFQADVYKAFNNFMEMLTKNSDPTTGRRLLDRYLDPNLR